MPPDYLLLRYTLPGMKPWMVRAVSMTLLHAAAQVGVALVRVELPGSLSVSRWAAVALLVGAGAAWGAVDGWLRREAPALTWFTAGLVAGLPAVLLAVLARAMFIDATGAEVIGVALISGAAFTALLVMLPALLGVGAGRLLTAPPDRQPEPSGQR